jgi:hypothetical protein
VLLAGCLVLNELPRNELYVLKRSHHGLVETTRVINLPNLEGPLLGENILDHRAKGCRSATFLATDAAFLAPLTLNSERCQVFRCDRTGQILTCLESVKIPGRYQAIIMPCMSTTIHGIEAVTPFSGGYRRLKEASFSFEALVPGFNGFFGSLSA